MDSFKLALIGCGIIFAICIPINIYQKIKEQKAFKKYQNGDMTEEEKKLFEQKLKSQEDFMQKQQRAKTISKVMIVANNSDSRKKVGSSIMRGTVGGALLGPAGLVGGALSGKNKVTNETTFLIEYADGHRETKVVNNNSSEFKKLCKYLEM